MRTLLHIIRAALTITYLAHVGLSASAAAAATTQRVGASPTRIAEAMKQNSHQWGIQFKSGRTALSHTLPLGRAAIASQEEPAPPLIISLPPGGDLGCNPNVPDDDNISSQVVSEGSCPDAPVTISVSHKDINDGCLVTRTFRITATDACGSARAAVAYTWTTDAAPPTITSAPTGADLGCNPASLPTDESIKAQVTATDACGSPTINVTHNDSVSGCVTTRTFALSATDACGNTSAITTAAYTWTTAAAPPTTPSVPSGADLGCNPASLPTDESIRVQVTATDACGVAIINVAHSDSVSGCVTTRTFAIS
ncbi:MAG: hypothetical protein L0Z50_20725, partial [Verrucomicrobiales bacterium]|nr:hypothetical protein [Verrucomicrobiales bacterium]